MSVETVLMDFQVVPCLEEVVYVRDVATVATCVAEALRQDCLEQGCISSAFSYSAIYSGPKDCMFTIKHYFREGLITLTIEYFKINQDDALLYNFPHVENLEKLITRNLDASKGSCLPAIQRCLPRSPYLRSSDDRLLQMGWKKLLFSERSPYQLVEIYSTLDFGNCLVLDGFINLAESDLAYTQALMCHGKQDYKDKEVLILGGGDGALLHELIKEKPKFVTMVDIDEAVIRGCKEHLREACGEVLDKYEADNYKIVVDDALKWLAKFQEDKKQFYVIFGDLTDIPVHGGDTTTWAFVRNVVRTSLLLLPVGGKYYTHVNGANSTNALLLFEQMLKELGVPIDIAHTHAHVPSFMEKWVFYQVTRLEGEVKEEVMAAGVEPEAEGTKLTNGTNGTEEKKEETAPAAEEKKEAKEEKKKTSADKKEDKKTTGGAKATKDSLESPKGLKEKEKSNVEKKGAKKAK